MKRCAKCGETKPLDQFFKNRARSDGVSGYCRPCQTEANSGRHQRLRTMVMDALGGPVCLRCGFDDVRALTIDHKNGGGTNHRREAVSMWSIYRHALENPDLYQVLCWNCNYIKRIEEGEIPSAEYVAAVRSAPYERVTRPIRWARDFDSCTECGTAATPHHSGGLCENCYMRRRRAARL